MREVRREREHLAPAADVHRAGATEGFIARRRRRRCAGGSGGGVAGVGAGGPPGEVSRPGVLRADERAEGDRDRSRVRREHGVRREWQFSFRRVSDDAARDPALGVSYRVPQEGADRVQASSAKCGAGGGGPAAGREAPRRSAPRGQGTSGSAREQDVHSLRGEVLDAYGGLDGGGARTCRGGRRARRGRVDG